ncbi:hypothetical protein [Streptomyces sp. NBC_01643]|uniref:hypothetical protein n=1 Tax=Streptomyces sp. NBC_01643 TaxID=2975906 RepID=UPI002F91A42C|nr:hypothetical protein OHB03_47160 [Streptomyces sp. NBC_01643]
MGRLSDTARRLAAAHAETAAVDSGKAALAEESGLLRQTSSPTSPARPAASAADQVADADSVVSRFRRGTPPLPIRSPVNMVRLTRSLEAAGAELAVENAALLCRMVQNRLGTASVSSLTGPLREEVIAMLRTEIAARAPATDEVLGALATELRVPSHAELRRAAGDTLHAARQPWTTVQLPDGIWIYYHLPGRRQRIEGEVFVPFSAARRVPDRPPLPGADPDTRWRQPDGTYRDTPPPLPREPVRLASGLAAASLTAGPELILQELALAEVEATEALERWIRPSPASVSGSLPRGVLGRPQGLVTSVAVHPQPVLDGKQAWDVRTVITARTGPETKRLSSSVLQRLLPDHPGRLDPRYEGYVRMHLLGPVVGSESLAGLAWGPQRAANLLELTTVEEFLRWDAKRTRGLNPRAGSEITVTGYQRYVPVRDRVVPMLVTASYWIPLDNGESVRAVIDVDKWGKVLFWIE